MRVSKSEINKPISQSFSQAVSQSTKKYSKAWCNTGKDRKQEGYIDNPISWYRLRSQALQTDLEKALQNIFEIIASSTLLVLF